MYQYQNDDLIYDIESLENFFVFVGYYPKNNQLAIYYIDDDDNLKDNETKQKVINKIKNVVPFPNNVDIQLYDLTNHRPNYLNNLHRFVKMLGVCSIEPLNNKHFVKNNQIPQAYCPNIIIKDGKFDVDIHDLKTPDELKPSWYLKYIKLLNKNNANESMIKSKTTRNFKINYLLSNWENGPFPGYLPVYKSDTGLYDPSQFGQGLRLGYNSHNYDETMLAGFMRYVNWRDFEYQKLLNYEANHSFNDQFDQDFDPDNAIVPSAATMRDLNNTLFNKKNINSMSSYWTMHSRSTRQQDNKLANYTKNAWKYSNRFLDVARLNEHLAHISLKRLSGVIGLKIKESDKLDDGEDVISINTIDDLIAYCTNDVFNTMKLFEQKTYQDSMQLRNDLLKIYPQLQYSAEENFEPSPLNIDAYRINSDSSSAQTIAKVIAPDHPLKDNPTIDLTYPDAKVFEQLKHDTQSQLGAHYKNLTQDQKHTVYYDDHGEASPLINQDHPYNVLQQTKNWYIHEIKKNFQIAKQDIQNGTAPEGLTIEKLKDNWNHAWANFTNIYNYYHEVESQNVNATLDYGKSNLTNEQIDNRVNIRMKKLMIKYDKLSPDHTGLCMYYYDKYGQPSTCFARFSVGGIHGQEINYKRFQHDYRIYQEQAKNYQQDKAELDKLKIIYDQIKDQTDSNAKAQKELVKQYRESDKYQDYNLDRIFTKSNMLRKRFPKLKKAPTKPVIFKEPSPSKREQSLTDLNKKYTYTSIGLAFHEDFSSYYPLLLSRLAVFRDDITGIDTYMNLYLERLQYKARLGQLAFKSPEWLEANQQQLLRKLLLNSASGAGDAKFYSPIRMNNKITSMRIIGQLFAWRIGQAEAFHGARVISTNTDGLYTMPNDKYPEFNEELNAKVLQNTVKPMLIDIEPETVTYFVSKDANNRLEEYDGVVKSSKGGTLNSSDGPTVGNSLSHPAMLDAILSAYLDHHGSVDHQFDNQMVLAKLKQAIIKNRDLTKRNSNTGFTPQEQILRFSQWIFQANPNTDRYQILKQGDQYKMLSRTNRVYLIDKEHQANIDSNLKGEIYTVTHGKVTKNTAYDKELINKLQTNDLTNLTNKQQDMVTEFKLLKRAKNCTTDELIEYLQSAPNAKTGYPEEHEPKIVKSTGMIDHQLVVIDNRSWSEIINDQNYYNHLINALDLQNYVNMAETMFNNSWLNQYE